LGSRIIRETVILKPTDKDGVVIDGMVIRTRWATGETLLVPVR
jgi:hypothetical protein